MWQAQEKQRNRSAYQFLTSIRIHTRSFSFFILLVSAAHAGSSQPSTIENSVWKVSLRNNGTIQSLHYKKSKNTYAFFEYFLAAGPAWYGIARNKPFELTSKQTAENRFTADYEDIDLSLEYKNVQGKLAIVARITNRGHTPFQPEKLGLRMGLDTYMDRYPAWEDKLFPTLLRCEPTHFWGYFMGTRGTIVVIASPDPIASWSHDYSKNCGRLVQQYNGHRIISVNLDLINALPLPSRHPQHLWQIVPGETKTFRIFLDEVPSLDAINKTAAQLTQAPVIDIAATSCEKNRTITFSVLSSDDLSVTVTPPSGFGITLQPATKSSDTQTFQFNKTSQEGLYFITAESSQGKKTEATFYVRKPYSWYMKQAMQAVLEYPQKASISHAESWYGLYTAYAGGKHFPKSSTIAAVDKQFNAIVASAFDTITYTPLDFLYRIQNVSSMIGILVDRYQLRNDNHDLQRALKLSEYLLKSQSPDGAYRGGKTHYTSVIYIAKSLMELMEVLKKEKKCAKQYKKIYASVKKAMNELAKNRSNINTEGELTFEDGMISSSALQLGQFALLQTKEKEREKYTDAAIDLLTQHQCLEQLIIPDARMRSGTIRFWEAQYDVLMNNNFFNSPHGWTSWSLYANYYLYQLTGDIKYLVRMFNGLGATMQMIDLNGKLRWAFAVNPYLKVTQISENFNGATPMKYEGVHYHAEKNRNRTYVMGEQYVDMVSDWFFANANDNDVHEHFKFLEEAALTKAYVAEKDTEDFLSYNCSAILNNGVLYVTPSEKLVDKVHFNLQSDYKAEISFQSKKKETMVKKGLQWIVE